MAAPTHSFQTVGNVTSKADFGVILFVTEGFWSESLNKLIGSKESNACFGIR